jgi:hypothetical protein
MKTPSLKLSTVIANLAIVFSFSSPYLFLKYKDALICTLVILVFSLSSMVFNDGIVTVSIMVTVTVIMILLFKYGPLKEGFDTHATPEDVAKLVNKMKASEGFEYNMMDDEDEERPYGSNGNYEGFRGSGPNGLMIEGYEDVKKEKDEKPAPVKEKEKETLPMPFTLGEIPSQVKNGPHIDAGSTLMKAIKSLNPDQINAMTKDTQQLIETQKSLMGMLGTMKPMLNDGKQLMETFQQMFGQ